MWRSGRRAHNLAERMLITHSGAPTSSVHHGPFSVIDHEDVNQLVLRRQHQAELVLDDGDHPVDTSRSGDPAPDGDPSIAHSRRMSKVPVRPV